MDLELRVPIKMNTIGGDVLPSTAIDLSEKNIKVLLLPSSKFFWVLISE
jgi:hypothetical protein